MIFSAPPFSNCLWDFHLPARKLSKPQGMCTFWATINTLYQSQDPIRLDWLCWEGQPRLSWGERLLQEWGAAVSTAVHLAGAHLEGRAHRAGVSGNTSHPAGRAKLHSPKYLWSCLQKICPALDTSKVPSSHQEHLCWMLFYAISVRQNQTAL